jgi:hypothetical protein
MDGIGEGLGALAFWGFIAALCVESKQLARATRLATPLS